MSAGLSSASRTQNGSSREWLSRLLTADGMVRSFSLDEYHQLVELGFFADERLELIPERFPACRIPLAQLFV